MKTILNPIVLILICMCVSPMNASAQQDAVCELVTFLIPNFVESEEKGVFIDLVREIEKRSGISCRIQVVPPKRAFSYFEEKTVAGLFPGTSTRLVQMGEVARSDVFYMKRNTVFTRKDISVKNIKDMEAKTLGLTTGYTYPPELMKNPNIRFENTDSDATGFRMLCKGRIDGVIAEELSGLKVLEECDCKNDLHYQPDFFLDSQTVCFVFQPTERGKMLADQFSKAIREMKKDGTLQKILNVSDQWMKALPQQ